MADFTELDRIDEEIRRIDLESYLHEHISSTSIVDAENELEFLDYEEKNNEESLSKEQNLDPSRNADQEPLLKNLALLRRGAPETMERLVATIHEQEVQIHTLQMGLGHASLQVQAVQGRERQLQHERNVLEYSLALSEQDKLLLEVSLKEVSDFEGHHVGFHGLDSVRGKLLTAANNRVAELADQLLVAQNALRAKNAAEEEESEALQNENIALRKQLNKVSEQLAQRAVLYAAQERRFLDNARIYTSEFSDRTSEIADVRGRLQQLERQYSITDRERMEAVFNQRQLQQALATAQEAHRELQQQLESSQAELSSATYMITTLQETVDRLRSADLEELEMSFTREVEDLRQSFRVREDSLQQQLAHSQRLLSQAQVTASQHEEELNNLRRKMYVLQASEKDELVFESVAHLPPAHFPRELFSSPVSDGRHHPMANLNQPSHTPTSAPARDSATLTHPANHSPSDYYFSAEDTLTFSVSSAPAALSRELQLETALFGSREDEGEGESGSMHARGAIDSRSPSEEHFKRMYEKADRSIHELRSKEKAQREEMKKLKSFLKQVLKRAAEVGAADPPSQLPLKEQLEEKLVAAEKARDASFALLDETVGGYKETIHDLKLQISAQASLSEAHKDEILLLQRQVRLTEEERDRQIEVLTENKDREIRLAIETENRRVRSAQDEKEILELQMEILKGDFELNLNAIAEMNLRFEQLLTVNNRTNMECEDVRSALFDLLSRPNLNASKVKFSDNTKRDFFDLSVGNIRFGRPFLPEVSFASTPAEKAERISLIGTSPPDRIEGNSLTSDPGGSWLFGEDKNHSGLGLGCEGSDTTNASALGQVEQLLLQRNEFEMRIIKMRESLLNSAEIHPFESATVLVEQMNEAQALWLMSCADKETKEAQYAELLQRQREENSSLRKVVDERAQYKQESLNWQNRAALLSSERNSLEIMCEGFRLDCVTLRTEIDEVSAEKEKVRVTLENLQADYENLTAELENSKKESRALQSNHRLDKKNHVDEVSRDFHIAKETIRFMEASLAALTAEKRQLTSALTDVATKMASFSAQEEEKEKDRHAERLREEECSSLRDTAAALSAELQSALSSKEQLQDDLNLLGLQTDQLRRDLQSMTRLQEAETISKSQQVARYEELLKAAEERAVVDLTSLSARLQQEIDEKQSALDSATASLEGEKLLRCEIEADHQRVSADLTALSASYNEVIGQSETLVDELSKLQSLYAQCTAEQLTSRTDMQSQLVALRDAKNKVDTNYKELLQFSESQRREKLALMETSEKEHAELQAFIAEQQANLTALQHELEVKRTEMASLATSNVNLTEEVTALKQFLHQVEESHVQRDTSDTLDASQVSVDITSEIEPAQSAIEKKQHELEQVGRLQDMVTSLQAQLIEQKQRLRSRYLSKLQQQEEKFLHEKQQLLELVKLECKQTVDQIVGQMTTRPNLAAAPVEDGAGLPLSPRPSLSDPVFHSPPASFIRPPVSEVASGKAQQPIHDSGGRRPPVAVAVASSSIELSHHHRHHHFTRDTDNAHSSTAHNQTADPEAGSAGHVDAQQSIRNTIHHAAQTIKYAHQNTINQDKLLASISDSGAGKQLAPLANATQPSRVFNGISSTSSNLQDSNLFSGSDLGRRSFSSPAYISGTTGGGGGGGGGGVRVPLSVSMPVIYPEMLSPELTLELVQKIVGRSKIDSNRILVDKPMQS